MSAVIPNTGDRELEALRHAQRAHEPSMEEILASIRNIIADERDPAKTVAPRTMPQRPASPPPGPQIVFSKDPRAAPQQAAIESPEDPGGAGGFEANASKVVAWRQPEPVNSSSAEKRGATDAEPLLSPETGAVVTSAFQALSATLAARSAEIADGVIREMLRPMLKAWLDENLPGIVERLVRAEIERLSRGTR
jgi:cell pole-organizing protein PopZ